MAAVLVLSSAGSASLLAQSADPFDDVDPYAFMCSMQMSVKVVMDETALTDDVTVAVYAADGIRGKSVLNNANYPGVVYLTVYGYYEDPLYFKVYTGGRVIETDPGDLAFEFYGSLGESTNPYIIDLPAPIVTTPSTEGWATTCLPYNAEVPDGVTLYNAAGIEDGDLMISKIGVGSSENPVILPKDTPVLLYSEGKTSYEWLSRVADSDIITTGSIFKGTTEKTTVNANSVLTLGHSQEGSHEIGFWRFAGTSIPANRAYVADIPAGVRGVKFRLEDTTGIVEAPEDLSAGEAEGEWYDLTGRKTSKRKGLVKRNSQGQQIIIR